MANLAAFVPGQWCLYLLECQSGAFYAGITNDLAKRYAAHERGTGAKYTRANRPRRVLACVAFDDRAQASKAEWQIKQMPKSKKLEFIRNLAQTGQRAVCDKEDDCGDDTALSVRPLRPTP